MWWWPGWRGINKAGPGKRGPFEPPPKWEGGLPCPLPTPRSNERAAAWGLQAPILPLLTPLLSSHRWATPEMPGVGRLDGESEAEGIMPGICKLECHRSQCNERHQFVGGGTFAPSPAWRRLCSAAQRWAARSAVPLWRWPVTGSKGADEGGQRSRRHNQAAAATLSRREEAHSGPLLWYCSWPGPTTHPPSLSKQFVSLIAPTHTAQQTVSPICSSICRIKASKVQVFVGCFGQTQNRTLLSFRFSVQLTCCSCCQMLLLFLICIGVRSSKCWRTPQLSY